MFVVYGMSHVTKEVALSAYREQSPPIVLGNIIMYSCTADWLQSPNVKHPLSRYIHF